MLRDQPHAQGCNDLCNCATGKMCMKQRGQLRDGCLDVHVHIERGARRIQRTGEILQGEEETMGGLGSF